MGKLDKFDRVGDWCVNTRYLGEWGQSGEIATVYDERKNRLHVVDDLSGAHAEAIRWARENHYNNK